MFLHKEYTHGFKMVFFPYNARKNRHVLLTMLVTLLFSLTINTPAFATNKTYEYVPQNSKYQENLKDAQTLVIPKTKLPTAIVLERFDFEVLPPPQPVTPKPRPAPNAAVVGEAQAYARTLVANESEWNCLYNLWARESGWRVEAYNPSSGATGIPQALPGSKMASAGADWETNPVTQINWGMGYINGRYGSPCNAWAHSEAKGWY